MRLPFSEKKYNNRRWRSEFTAVALCVIALSAGCAYLPQTQVVQVGSPGANTPAATTNLTNPIELVSIDLVNALMQIEGKHPARTKLHMLQPQNDFSRHLHKVLLLAGYGVDVGDDQGSGGFVDYLISDTEQTSDGPVVTYQLAIDDVKIKRDYIISNDQVSPASSLFVKGADPTNIGLNDHIFTTGVQVSNDRATEGLAGSSSNQVIVAAVEEPVINVGQPSTTVTSPTPSVSSETSSGSGSIFPTTDVTRQKGNVYDLGSSNYSNLFVNYIDLSKTILTFGNDDYRVLGKQNKAKLMQLVDEFEGSTDIFSVIGCSHGTSHVISEGDPNALLALGRASRVKEELLIVGVPEDKILDEGCWSVVHYDEVMPRRGVVVSLKRSRI